MGTSARRSPLSNLGALVGGLVTGRLRRYEIAEHSMRPTLRSGDWVIALARPGSVRPGDVVVLDHPNRPGFELVKRVASIDDDGVLVLGDDPAAGSVDSVRFGAVPPRAVSARVLMRYRPLPSSLIR